MRQVKKQLLILAMFGVRNLAAGHVHAEHMVPLKAINQGSVAISDFDPSAGIITISTVHDVGTSTHIGRHTGIFVAQINLKSGAQSAPKLTVVGPNERDKYHAVYFASQPDPSDPANPFKMVYHAEIISGEGRFAGASGQYTVHVVSDRTIEQLIATFLSTQRIIPAHYVAVVEGEISAPNPPAK